MSLYLSVRLGQKDQIDARPANLKVLLSGRFFKILKCESANI